MNRALPLTALALIVIGALGLIAIGGLTRPQFRSNGEQIYFTATSQRGSLITADIGMGPMGGGMMACANCHGPDGRGGCA
ncbi:MAG: hypothetical protein C4309_06570 [Chloroflexota bacterium]